MPRPLVLAVAALIAGCSQPAESISRPPSLAGPGAHRSAHGAAAPWTLTASDGSGLLLVRADVKAVIQGPLAFTELHLYFHNAEPRQREGTFAVTLPPRAAVSRFAMEHAGAWQEAEVVDKTLARRAYEDFLHHRQDPALLERAAGNQFTARVFPIEPKADKHLVISYSQELAGEYRLPLQGLPKTERIDVRVDTAGEPQELHERNWLPDHDVVIAAAGPVAVAAGTLVAGTLAVSTPTAATPPTALTLLVDTSASRALGFADYLARVRELVTGLRARYGEALALQVVAFDQETHPVFDGRAADFGDDQLAALVERGAAGASNLGQAIDALAHATPHRRIVVVTDGVVTAGAALPDLTAAIAKLPADRLDVVLAGGIRDDRLAAALVRALPHAGDVFDLDRDVPAVAAGLGEAVRLDVTIDVPGATWVYPRKLASARTGTPVTVYARIARPGPVLQVAVDGAISALPIVTGSGGAATAPALLDRAVAQAEIEELEHTLETSAPASEAANALRKTISARSTAARVVSSQTALLVLERDADYARYGIDRQALADILVVGARGLEQTRRTFVANRESDVEPAPPEEEERGGTGTAMALDEGKLGKREAGGAGVLGALTSNHDFSSGFDDNAIYGAMLGDSAGGDGAGASGRYGTIGMGNGSGSGFGYGAGTGWGGLRGRRPEVAQVRLGQLTSRGELDKTIVRRYLKRNFAKIQYCYEKALLAKPTLRGALVVQFAITDQGRVDRVVATGLDPAVATCLASVVRAIEFPHPTSGTVEVRSPFTFAPPSAAAEPARMPVPPPIAPVRFTRDPSGPPELHTAALTGRLDQVMTLVASGKLDEAQTLAKHWRDEQPGDVLALIAVGEVLEARADLPAAARIYGSIIDLYPARADFRRFAGERLERLGDVGRKLAIDSYRRAVADRPDHATGHRLLAYALLRDADYAGAFSAILDGVDRPYFANQYRGVQHVFADDVGMIAAAYLAHGGDRAAITVALGQRALAIATRPSTRFILYWETDANDVDFHIQDAGGDHAWYRHPGLASGGTLYADVTTGYGPECFAIDGATQAGPYKLSLQYYSQGPMGYGMGLLQIQRFDGKGAITFEDRPYVIMTDHAFVDLGVAR